MLDHDKLGLSFEVFASVKLQLPSRENLETFESAVETWPEVVECATVTGAVDYMLRVITRDMHAYDDFLRDKMLALGLVSDVQSRIIMRVPKRTTAAPRASPKDRHGSGGDFWGCPVRHRCPGLPAVGGGSVTRVPSFWHGSASIATQGTPNDDVDFSIS